MRRRSNCSGFAVMDCCSVVAEELQAEFIYKHVEGEKAVDGTGVGSIGIHHDVGVVRSPNKELYEEPALPVVAAPRLVQACNLVILVHRSHVPARRGKVKGQNIHAKLCEKSWELTYLV